MGKVSHWELCKKLKFTDTAKLYIHKPESVLDNETRKILWLFEIQTNHLIPIRGIDLVVVNKENGIVPNRELCRPTVPQSENQRKRKQK